MMSLSDIGRLIRRNAKENSPLILSCVAGVGTLTTAYLASRASFQAARLIDAEESTDGTAEDTKQRIIERTKLVWKLYIPTAVSATSTIACIVGANRIGVRKTIAAQTALSISQQLYSDYKDKVIEELGERKEETIRAKVAEDRIKKDPPPAPDVLVTGGGEVLCLEIYTGRYFTSDMETLRKAQNDINAKLLAHDYATLTDFYWMVGVSQTQYSSSTGWTSSKQMDLQFSSVLTDDGRPCLAFEYNYTTAL